MQRFRFFVDIYIKFPNIYEAVFTSKFSSIPERKEKKNIDACYIYNFGSVRSRVYKQLWTKTPNRSTAQSEVYSTGWTKHFFV